MIEITEDIMSQLEDATQNVSSFSKTKEKKKLQATFECFLDQCSKEILNEPCSNKFMFRKKLNQLPLEDIVKSKRPLIVQLKQVLANDNLLYDKTYVDHSGDVKKFLENHLVHLLVEIRNATY